MGCGALIKHGRVTNKALQQVSYFAIHHCRLDSNPGPVAYILSGWPFWESCAPNFSTPQLVSIHLCLLSGCRTSLSGGGMSLSFETFPFCGETEWQKLMLFFHNISEKAPPLCSLNVMNVWFCVRVPFLPSASSVLRPVSKNRHDVVAHQVWLHHSFLLWSDVSTLHPLYLAELLRLHNPDEHFWDLLPHLLLCASCLVSTLTELLDSWLTP